MHRYNRSNIKTGPNTSRQHTTLVLGKVGLISSNSLKCLFFSSTTSNASMSVLQLCFVFIFITTIYFFSFFSRCFKMLLQCTSTSVKTKCILCVGNASQYTQQQGEVNAEGFCMWSLNRRIQADKNKNLPLQVSFFVIWIFIMNLFYFVWFNRIFTKSQSDYVNHLLHTTTNTISPIHTVTVHFEIITANVSELTCFNANLSTKQGKNTG